jgi:hypothetical protein
LTGIWLLLLTLLLPSATAATFSTTIAVQAVIPDNQIAGMASRVDLPTYLGSLTRVRVSLNVTGGWNGDLYCQLSHGPHLAVLLNRVGRSTNNSAGDGGHGMEVTFDDAATNGEVHVSHRTQPGAAGGVLTGAWAPDARTTAPRSTLDTDPRTAPLGVFQGADAAGAWTLFIADVEAFDIGTLVSWTLEVTADDSRGYEPPPDVLTVADPGRCFASGVNLGEFRISLPYRSVSSNSPPVFEVGTTEVVWTVTLTNNEQVTATQRVTVADLQVPQLTAPADLSFSLGPGQCGIANPNLGAPAAEDNCGLASVTNDAPPVFTPGRTRVVWTATDIHGRQSSQTQWVTVSDPFFNCPASSGNRPRISEFMAVNSGGLRDAAGETTDWIEIHNPGPKPVDLGGWHLTDEPGNLAKWTLPSTPLEAGAYLVVFASGQDRAVAGEELHTNFRLNAAGGYLALVFPDGVTVAQEYAPYPRQRENVSYGTGMETLVTPLIGPAAAARYSVPTNATADAGWQAPEFNDTAWRAATLGIGFDSTGGSNQTGTVVLAVDFNDREAEAATTTMAGFSSFVIASNLSAAAVQTASVTRVIGPYTLTLAETSGSGYDDRLRLTPTNAGAFTEGALLRDFVFSRDFIGGQGLDLSIAGLRPNQAYQVSVWSFDSGSPGARISDWLANGTPVRTGYTFDGASLPLSNESCRFDFSVQSSPAGQVQVAGRRNPASAPSTSVILNAIRLTETGYGAAIATDVAAAMHQRSATVYVRVPFRMTNAAGSHTLRLRIRYDDGFAAWINGQAVAARNAPAAPAHDSAATAAHSGGEAESITITVPPGLLVEGENLLAVQGLNRSAADPDFLLAPELETVAVREQAGRYLGQPTPGTNNPAGFGDLVADTKFSVDRGFFGAPFPLEITCETPGAAIYYTTNGSAPTPANGQLYRAPITIAGQSFIRAAAFLADWLPSNTDTHSYLFLGDVLRQSNSPPNLPATWQGGYPADYAMDPSIVAHPVYGATLSNDLRSLPSLCLVTDHEGLWNAAGGIYPNPINTGPAWEREASLELIRGDGRTEFATTARIQMHGNASRDNARTPKHALGVSFNSDYGPTKLRYDWFGGGVAAHDKIVLRNCGFVDGWAGRYADEGLYTNAETGAIFRGQRYRPETSCYLRDAWVKDSFRAMGWEASRSQYVHLYLNGLYWGLYEPSEHIDAAYVTGLLGGPEGAWDVLVGEDNNGPPVVVDGQGDDWTNVLNLVNAGIRSEADYQAIEQLVELDNLIDYQLIHFFAEAEDWPRHNWYLYHRRATPGAAATRFRFTVWDQELTLDRMVRRNRQEVGTAGGEVYGPARVYAQLRQWPEFRRRFGDRVQKHLFNGGALTPGRNAARLTDSAALIRSALVGESARWGDARKFPTPGCPNGTGTTFTRDEWWQPEIDQLTTNLLARLTADNVARLRAAGLFPALEAPGFSQFGGAVPAGFSLSLSNGNPSGTIFFTTNGQDPRTPGSGAVASAAQAFDRPVLINTPTEVRARVLAGTNWSALVEAVFHPPQDLSRLAITEIMYHPAAEGQTEGDEFEFLELGNSGTSPLNLSGLTFTEGITLTFSNGTLLPAGGFLVLVRNPVAFATRYPSVAVGGVYGGRLDNGGERITLAHPFGGVVLSVTYGDVAPWPVAADGYGFSLVRSEESPASEMPWRASTRPGGSPGTGDGSSTLAPIVINEVLSASGPGTFDQIELFNPTATNADIGGWLLTDDPGAPFKFRIPEGTRIPARGYALFDETQFNAGGIGFALSALGEAVYLLSGDAQTNLTGYSHGFAFGAAAEGVSFGRQVNSAWEEQFPAQVAPTFGQTNAGPRVGPVVINEIHYHPAVGGDEFLELKNITAAPVQLSASNLATNGWRLNGLGFDLPTNLTLPPGGLALLVATNPTDFRLKYQPPPEVPVLGPYAGALQQDGERVQLEQPLPPVSNSVYYLVVDTVRYHDQAPWPSAADGGGESLQRIDPAAYGDDPVNWVAALPTPGRERTAYDSDGDGLPDAWEEAHGTNLLGDDGSADPDRDGLTNFQEFLAGTDPQDPTSVLRLQWLPGAGEGGITLSFTALSNRSYAVQTRAGIPAGDWTNLVLLPGNPVDRQVTVTNRPAGSNLRLYRVVTP